MPRRLSLVIVTWRSRDVLARCLHSLIGHPPSCWWEVIVVDNASGDGTLEMLRGDFPWVRVVANGSNRGLSAANNQGLIAASGDVVVICNPDIEFTAGALDAMVETMERTPTAGFVVPRMRQPDGCLQVGAGELPSLRGALLGRQWSGRHGGAGFAWHEWAQDDERTIGHGNDACYAVRREALAAVGPQDERFPLDWEAIDWSARLGDAGWEIWFCPSAEVVHLGGASIDQAKARWVVLSHRGLYRYFAKRGGLARRVWLAPVVALRALAKLTTLVLRMPVYAQAQQSARASVSAGHNDAAQQSSPVADRFPPADFLAAADPVDVSLVFVTWRSRDVVAECLAGIEAAPPRGSWEVVVVDNASDDGTVEMLAARYPWARVIANTTNRGLAAANNQGLLLSRGATVVFSNPDVVFLPDAVDELVSLLERRRKSAFCEPQVRLANGGLQSVAGDLPTVREALLGRVAAHRRARRRGGRSGFCWDGWTHDEEVQVGRAGDVCYAARRAALVELGPLDERFPLDWEAIDWSARAAEAGWEIWFTPRAKVTHHLGSSTGQAAAMWWIFATHRGMYRYFRKRFPAAAPLLATAFAARALLKACAVAARIPVQDLSRQAQRVMDTSDSTVSASESGGRR